MSIIIPPKKKFLSPPFVRSIDDPRDPLNLGLVGHWTMDAETINGPRLLDLSGFDNHAAMVVGAATSVPGRVGQALSFDTSRYATAPDSSSLRFPLGVSICAWVKVLGGANTFRSIAVKSATAGWVSPYAVYALRIEGASNLLEFWVNDGGDNANYTKSSVSIPVADVWRFFVATYDGTGRIYLDGLLNNTKFVGPPINASAFPLYIGNDPSTGSGWNGLIDDLRIYNRALSATEVWRLYNNPARERVPYQTRGRLASAVDDGSAIGTLALTEAPDTLSAGGAVTGTIGQLAVTEAPDTLSARGWSTALATFAASEQSDVLTMRGIVSGVQTIYLLGTAGVTPNFFGNTQLNGAAPTAANSAFGWGPAKTAVTTPYYRGRIGATTTGSDAAVASSTISGLTAPRAGTGTGAATASDSFVIGPLNGTFAASLWTFNFNLRATTAGAIGHINLIGYKSANANGSGATTLISFRLGAGVTLSTTADANSSVGYTPGTPVVFNDEYLFIQLEWQETTAGSSNSDNVFFRIGTSSITTSAFTPAVSGTLAKTEQIDALAGTGTVLVRGTLARTEALDALSATGAVTSAGGPTTGTLAITEQPDGFSGTGWSTATGTLARTEAPDTLAALGGPVVAGTLARTEAPDTLGAAATVLITGTLARTEALDALAASAGPIVGGTLTAIQATHALAAQGKITVGGNLTVTQAAQGLAASGTVLVGATLGITQALQSLAAAGTILVTATLVRTQADQSLAAQAKVTVGATLAATQAAHGVSSSGTVLVSGSLSQIQAAQTLDATGSVFSGTAGDLNLTQANHTLAATGTVPAVGTLAITQGPQALSATGTVLVSGALAAAQAAQTLAAAGGPVVAATLSVTQAAQTLAAVGTVLVTGALAVIQAPQTLAATGTSTQPIISGALAVTEAPDALTARALGEALGTLAKTQADHALAGVARVTVTGTLARTQADHGLAATGALTIAAVLGLVQDSQIILARGGPIVAGHLARTQENQTIDATGLSGTIIKHARVIMMA